MPSRKAAAMRAAIAAEEQAAPPPSDVIEVLDDPAIDPESLAFLRGETAPPVSPLPAAPAPPPGVSVRFGDHSLEVDPAVAREIEVERLERERLRGEVEAFRRLGPPSAPAPAAPVVPERPPPMRPSMKLALDDIEAYEHQVREYEAWRELELERRLEARYRDDLEQREQVRRQTDEAAAQRRDLDAFVGRIVTTQPALEGEQDLILGAMRTVAQRHPHEPLPLTADTTLKLVATEASARLVRLAEKGRALTPRPPHVEGAGTRQAAAPAPAEIPKPVTIADIQRARRAQRRAGGRA